MRFFENKTILIVSPEAWGKNFVSKHHYATVLAQQNNQVYFLAPPPALGKKSVEVQQLEAVPNLHLVTYKPIVRGINRLPAFLRDGLYGWQWRKIKEQLPQELDVVWSFDPSRFQNLRIFGDVFKIYHPVDVHEMALEMQAVQTADLVLGSSHKILERFAPPTPPKQFINHGLAQHFIDPPTAIDFKVNPNTTNVGYVGNLHYQYLDLPVFTQIITDHPNINFYFIGPYQANNLSASEGNKAFVDWLQTQSNVHLLGSQPSKTLPAYLHQMDLFLMCYKGDKHVAQMANPHKILEYLSTGKTVVTHYIDQYKDHQDLVVMVKNNKDLAQKFKETLGHLEAFNQTEQQQNRRDFAHNNTYHKQIERIDQLIQQTIKTA